MAASIVSKSRNSPTRTTSGSCRKARRKASGEAGDIHVDFPLRDDGLLVLVVVFNGVFDGDDMHVVALFVDDVDHRSQRGGLARSGGPVTRTKPRGLCRSCWMVLRGRPISSSVSMRVGICRRTTP